MSLDRFKAAIATLVERLIGHRIDYLAQYPSSVITQALDGTLSVKPDSTLLPRAMTGIPIRLGLPGCTVKVDAGARVNVGFEAGDPDKPYAALWGPDGLNEVTIKANSVRLADGDIPLARVGDLVAVKIPGGANTGGPVVFTGVPDPSPLATAYGTIVSGSSKTRTG